MWLFFVLLTIILLAASVFGSKNRGSKCFTVIVFCLLGFLMMFRSINVGNDTDQYTFIFNKISRTNDIQLFIKSSRLEAGYIYLNKFLSMICDHPQILFIVTGAFTAFSFGRFIYKYSKLPWMSAYMFLTLQFFDLSMSGVRQILSIAILLFSYDFIINRKFFKFLLVVLLATTIHTSAIMFLIIYPLAKFRMKKFYLVSGVSAVAVFFGFQYLIPLIGKVFPQYINYLTNEGKSYTNTPTLAVFLMLALWLVLFIIAKMAYRNNKIPNEDIHSVTFTNKKISGYEATVSNVHEVAVWLGILMLFLALQGTILNRFKYIYSASILVFYPNALSSIIKDKGIRALLITGSCIVFFVYIMVIYIFRPEWQSTYPYTFFWQ